MLLSLMLLELVPSIEKFIAHVAEREVFHEMALPQVCLHQRVRVLAYFAPPPFAFPPPAVLDTLARQMMYIFIHMTLPQHPRDDLVAAVPMAPHVVRVFNIELA